VGSLQEFAACRVDEDAAFICGGAAARQAAQSTHTPVPAEARRTPWDRQGKCLFKKI